MLSSKKIKASVVIPTKNPGGKFQDILDSVCNQKTRFSYEVLVIDSGSSDGTVEYVKSYPDAKVKIIEISPSDFGHGKTRNYAISLSSGEYAVMITHDAMPTNEFWLASLVNIADTDLCIAGVFGRHIAYPTASPFTKRDLHLHFKRFEGEPVVWLKDACRYVNDETYRQTLHFFSDNNALLRRSVWEIIPYPDVNYAEDQLWARAIIEAGWKKAYAVDAVVYHSHDYDLPETLYRSFDESYALNRFFGYVLCSNVIQMMLSWLSSTKSDYYYACRIGMWPNGWRTFMMIPLRNLMRFSGHFLGSRVGWMPQNVRDLLSLNHRISLGYVNKRRKK